MQRATTNRPALSEGKNARSAPCAACPVRQQALCAALSDNEIGHLNEISVTRRYSAGATVIHEGSAAISGYNLISGHVGVVPVWKFKLAYPALSPSGFLTAP